ncbi:MAG: SAM-dependent methyltransferase [Dehalococcoidia bacterium]
MPDEPPSLDGSPTLDDFALAARSTPLARFIEDDLDAAADGRITFARFMALALGHPEHGYYSRGDLAWGARGDYETSPEVHAIFGYLWARQVEECWQRLGAPARFDLVEIGAGSGAFSVAVLTWLRARAPACFAAACPLLLDGHPNRIAAQRAAIAAVGLSARHALLDEWLTDPARMSGVVISNEFFDALPVHLVTRLGESDSVEWREWYVARSPDEPGALTLVEGPPSTPEIAAYFARLGMLPGDGARAEVGLAAIEAMRRIKAKVERGYVLTIDYGYEARDLYASWRREGTLMAFRAHSPVPDPLSEPGRTDITCHVDLTSLAAAALVQDGWEAAPPASQAEALTVLGLPEALRAAESRAHEDALRFLADRRAAEVLTDPAGLGRIRVLALAKDAPLAGLRCLRTVQATYGEARPR